MFHLAYQYERQISYVLFALGKEKTGTGQFQITLLYAMYYILVELHFSVA